ncbi:MAG: molecular chaperone DnaK [Candidatus Aminicenantes bacterium]|nr:molecular chaperone DnaK [Candidatus Aminicenantes bacterium]
MGVTVGIDLGTTNSCIAYLEGGKPVVIPNKEGGRITPSVVAFLKSGERLVGQLAKRQMLLNPERTVFAVKRLMGRKYDSPEVQELMRRFPYKIIEAENGDAWIEIDDKKYAPPEISALVLMYLKECAEEYLGEEVDKAIVTVPAYFDDAQRQATKDAGKIAGLEVLRIINEPTAASLAYGFDKTKNEVIAVYDLGGGTFDVTILEVREGVFNVLATSGNTSLGGEDFDAKIMSWLIEEFKNETGIDLSQDKLALQRLKDASEKAKIELSSVEETEINLPFIATDETGVKHLVRKLTREKFESLVEDLIIKTREPMEKALRDADLLPEDISKVILVGGQTRMPRIIQEVTEFFGKEPYRDINPDEVVAMGAALQGGVISGEVKDIVLLDVTPLSLGVETKNDTFTVIIPRNTTIPTKKTMIFTTTADNQTKVRIHVLQGEREIASANKSLGYFDLVGIRPAPKGIPQIEVTFEIDVDGIVKVTARDRDTGKAQSMEIHPSSGLSPQEIERMIEEAKKFREQDRIRKLINQRRSDIEALISSLEKSYTRFKDKLPSERKIEIMDAISDGRAILKEEEEENLKKLEAFYNELKKFSSSVEEEILNILEREGE